MKSLSHLIGLDQSRSTADLNAKLKAQSSSPDEAAVKRVAAEFESLFLSQITSAINPSPDDEEADLFGSSATQMYRQMMSEQLANTMAKNGGIGIAEKICGQLEAKSGVAGATKLTPAMDAAREIRGGATTSSADALSAAASGVPSKKSADEAKVAGKPSRDAKTPSVTGREQSRHHNHTRHPENSTSLRMPVNGTLTSKFGSRRDPIHGDQRNHRGIDIAAPRGTPIEAAATGTVVFAGRQGGYGKTVIIELPDGRQTRYAHAEKLLVHAGDEVKTGQVIATVGSTGRATGPHVHFEVTENGRAVNPLQVLAKDSTLARR